MRRTKETNKEEEMKNITRMKARYERGGSENKEGRLTRASEEEEKDEENTKDNEKEEENNN
ncbi:hypothetical protein E2C01_064247 [Portunus trituberculatus]|uniref:Uncharacterized protein n=1 Tax=Portunus trituberculatus TaxID=210409 RepID=A0A5B7HFR0_PORTR|nr:hypothetical protein [Portunus trituberculatus]